MRKIVLLILIIILNSSVFCQYAVFNIPQNLLKDANLVVRNDELTVEIINPGKAVYKHKYAYTILNEAADKYAEFGTYYDKFRDVKEISGTLYDAAGKKIKSVRKKDIMDLSGNMSDLANDARIKTHNFYQKSYPYTVEYEEEIGLDGIFYLPEWMPQIAPLVSLENASFIVKTPKDYGLRFKQFKYTGQPVVSENKSDKIYKWEIKNLNAKADESYSPEWSDLVTRVLIAPTDFEIGGVKGNMQTWQGFGKFMYALYAGRDVLPIDIKNKVHQIADPLKSNDEKIAALYKFMQNNTHYISIQLGMGGWQPLDANYVISKKYGDCKALSNYMVALLKEAGIKAYNALIWGGYNGKDVVTDFPSTQFNHVVACVPSAKDTTWLECTSQTMAPGYMGSFTGNRYAMLIDEKDSKLVRTPSYEKLANRQNRTINAILDAEGNIFAKVATTSTALQQDMLHQYIHELSDEENQKRLRTSLKLPNYDITKFSYTENKVGKLPSVTENLEFVSNNYATITGKRLFITPNLLSNYVGKIAEDNNRENDLVFDFPFVDYDTVNIKIPDGYKSEFLPKPTTLSNKFGTYNIAFEFNDGVIKMIRMFERNKGTFPSSSYKDFVAFYDQIYKSDNTKIVLVKTTD